MNGQEIKTHNPLQVEVGTSYFLSNNVKTLACKEDDETGDQRSRG